MPGSQETKRGLFDKARLNVALWYEQQALSWNLKTDPVAPTIGRRTAIGATITGLAAATYLAYSNLPSTSRGKQLPLERPKAIPKAVENPFITVLENGQIADIDGSIYFYNKTPGLKIIVNKSAIQSLLDDSRLALKPPGGTVVHTILLPTINISIVEQDLLTDELRILSSPKRTQSKSQEFYDGIDINKLLADILKNAPPDTDIRSSLAKKLSFEWAIYLRSRNQNLPDQTNLRDIILSPEDKMKIDNNMPITVEYIDPLLVQKARALITPQTNNIIEKKPPERVILYDDYVETEEGIIYNGMVGMEIGINSSAISQLIKDPDVLTLNVPWPNKLVIALLPVGNSKTESNFAKEDFERNQLKRLLLRAFPQRAGEVVPSILVIPVDYAIWKANSNHEPNDPRTELLDALGQELSQQWVISRTGMLSERGQVKLALGKPLTVEAIIQPVIDSAVNKEEKRRG